MKLKDPPVSQLRQAEKDVEDQSPQIQTSFDANLILAPSPFSVDAEQRHLELHPDGKHVFKLWRAFADNVNPLTKIVHAPTLQAQILEAAWAVESTTRPLAATMLAVYALAVNSMTSTGCIDLFGESKQVLVARYRTGALNALSATDILSTRRIEVLQALALILVSLISRGNCVNVVFNIHAR